MFRIVSKSINFFSRTSQPHKLFTLQLQQLSSSVKNSNKPISEIENRDAFTIGYLINEFGFSFEKAVISSKDVRFQNRENPDKVVSFLKNQEFSDTQIKKIISTRSRILILNPETILLPKIEFFRSKGASSTDLAKMIAFDANFLTRSLKSHIVPAFEFLRDFVGSDRDAIDILKRNARLLTALDYMGKQNISILTEAGVPHSNILYLLKSQQPMFFHCSSRLKESIEEVRKMGLDPKNCSFNLAISFMTFMSKSKWNKKLEAYKSWGCSENEVLASFKIFPWVMALSEKKINAVMSFCVNVMGWKPSEVMRKYNMLSLSLNKRIMPRWSVYQELVSRKLVKGESKTTMFYMKEGLFLERYVNRYKDEASILLKLYHEKMEASK